MDESYFPIKVALTDTETKIFKTPEEIPAGVHFKVLETKVKESKIINTGYAKVWPGVGAE